MATQVEVSAALAPLPGRNGAALPHAFAASLSDPSRGAAERNVLGDLLRPSGMTPAATSRPRLTPRPFYRGRSSETFAAVKPPVATLKPAKISEDTAAAEGLPPPLVDRNPITVGENPPRDFAAGVTSDPPGNAVTLFATGSREKSGARTAPEKTKAETPFHRPEASGIVVRRQRSLAAKSAPPFWSVRKSLGREDPFTESGDAEKDPENEAPPLRIPKPRPVSAIFLESLKDPDLPHEAKPAAAKSWARNPRPLSADLTTKFENRAAQRKREESNGEKAALNPKEPHHEKAASPLEVRDLVSKGDSGQNGASFAESSGEGSRDPTSETGGTETRATNVQQRIKELTAHPLDAVTGNLRRSFRSRPLPPDLTKRFATPSASEMKPDRLPEPPQKTASETRDEKERPETQETSGATKKPVATVIRTALSETHTAAVLSATGRRVKTHLPPENVGVKTVRATLFEHNVERHTVSVGGKSRPPGDRFRESRLERAPDKTPRETRASKERPLEDPSEYQRIEPRYEILQTVGERAQSEAVAAAAPEEKAVTLRSRKPWKEQRNTDAVGSSRLLDGHQEGSRNCTGEPPATARATDAENGGDGGGGIRSRKAPEVPSAPKHSLGASGAYLARPDGGTPGIETTCRSHTAGRDPQRTCRLPEPAPREGPELSGTFRDARACLRSTPKSAERWRRKTLPHDGGGGAGFEDPQGRGKPSFTLSKSGGEAGELRPPLESQAAYFALTCETEKRVAGLDPRFRNRATEPPSPHQRDVNPAGGYRPRVLDLDALMAEYADGERVSRILPEESSGAGPWGKSPSRRDAAEETASAGPPTESKRAEKRQEVPVNVVAAPGAKFHPPTWGRQVVVEGDRKSDPGRKTFIVDEDHGEDFVARHQSEKRASAGLGFVVPPPPPLLASWTRTKPAEANPKKSSETDLEDGAPAAPPPDLRRSYSEKVRQTRVRSGGFPWEEGEGQSGVRQSVAPEIPDGRRSGWSAPPLGVSETDAKQLEADKDGGPVLRKSPYLPIQRRSRSFYRERRVDPWPLDQFQQCFGLPATGAKDTDSLVQEPENQYGTCRDPPGGANRASAPVQKVALEDTHFTAICSSSSSDADPAADPPESAARSLGDSVSVAAHPPVPSEAAPDFSFLEETPVLDSSALKTRVQLSKRRRQHRAPISHSLRRSGGWEEGEAGTPSDPTGEESLRRGDPKEEGRTRPVERPPAPQPQRLPVFPGMDHSALQDQLRKRHDPEGTGSSVPSWSPKSRRLPTEERRPEDSSPQWLKDLKSKKRQRPPHENNRV